MDDERWMRAALEVARARSASEDVPVGAVIVRGEDVLATGGNRREADQDPTAHAEMVAIRAAARSLGNWHMDGCTLYVTLEPCAMCAGALVLARVDRVVFGASDPKAGFAGSLSNLLADLRLNHHPEVIGGVLEDECGDLLRAFFRERR